MITKNCFILSPALFATAFLLTECRAPKRALLFNLDFESGNLNNWHKKKLPDKSSALIVNEPVRHGRHAVQFTLQRGDRIVSKGKRAELQIFNAAELKNEYWYGLSIFLPNDWQTDAMDEVVAQWNATCDAHLGEDARRSPPLALRIKNNIWFITNRWDERKITPPGNTAPKTILWKGPFAKGVWTDWVVHARWSYESDGLIEIWKNGEKIIVWKGPNAYNDELGLRFKIGIYKPKWNDPRAKANIRRRVIYHDEVRIGGNDAAYEDVAPSAADSRAGQ